MAAANYSRDVLEMSYASNGADEIGEFEIVRSNFNEWLRSWRIRAKNNDKDLFKFYQKTKDSFINVAKKEVKSLKSIKIQFSLNARFYIYRNEQKEEMNHYFNRI